MQNHPKQHFGVTSSPQPDETVIETGEFNGDDTAEAKARELSKSNGSPIVVKRQSAHVDSWVCVTEVDERP